MNRKAFTLVELLVVITIIGILVGLTATAAVSARRRAKIAAVVMEVKQLEMACQAYKEKFGEYPPDFAGVDGSLDTDKINYPIQNAAQNAVLRHLARAFPRYQPGVPSGVTSTPWKGFVADVKLGWNLDISKVNYISPVCALAFWLGGQPNWLPASTGVTVTLADGSTTVLQAKPVSGFLGFAADPTNPFASSTVCTSRMKPFFDFDPNCIYFGTLPNGGLAFWPSSAYGASNVTSPVVYLRANNSTYLADGSTAIIRCSGLVCPAIDTRLSNVPGTANYNNSQPQVYTWVNPASFQIFSSGLDTTYGQLSQNGNPLVLTDRLYFPTSENYAPQTYDDITNFSGGTLEDAIP